MKLGLTIISYPLAFITLSLIVILIFTKKKRGKPIFVTNLVLSSIGSSLTITRLIMEIYIGEDFGYTIILLMFFVGSAIFNGYCLDNYISK